MDDPGWPVFSHWRDWLVQTPRFTPAVDFLDRLDPTKAFVTGGGVRDFFLDRPPTEVQDLDLLYVGDLDELARHPSTGRTLSRTLFGNPSLMLSTDLRVDIFPPASPRRVRLPLAEALEHADMSGNAIALPLDGSRLIDPTGGREDLRHGRTRLLEAGWDAPPEIAAMLLQRVVEQSARLNLRIENLGVADRMCEMSSVSGNTASDDRLRTAIKTYQAWRDGLDRAGDT